MSYLLLHGFTGDHRSWDEVRSRLDATAIDLPGHGDGPLADEVCPFEQAALALLERAGDASHLVGYSLGARLALSMLTLAPGRFSRATLIGVNPGLENKADRKARWKQDARWCALLREQGLEAFIEAWSKIPLFASQSSLQKHCRVAQAEIRKRQNHERLAQAMAQLSLAKMPNYWPRLGALATPVQLVVGSLDQKFLRIAQRMQGSLPSQDGVAAPLHIVEGAGHNVVLEAPQRVVELLERF